jgi:hypothetical protein
MNAIQPFVPREVVRTVAAFLEFCYLARRNIITEDSLEQLDIALKKFHESRKVFLGTVREDGPSAFSLPRQHSMVHYYDLIKDFGSPNGLCSSITESKHIVAVKRPWRRTNKHMALPQMLKINERLDKIAAARNDFMTRGMLTDSCLGQAIIDSLAGEETSGSETDSQSDDVDAYILNNGFFGDDGGFGSDVDDNDPYGFNNHHNHGLPYDNILDVSHLPPVNEEDGECGPVESGPLMNEVRLVGRKGKFK